MKRVLYGLGGALAIPGLSYKYFLILEWQGQLSTYIQNSEIILNNSN